MTASEIAELLEQQFGSAITGKNLTGHDPFVTGRAGEARGGVHVPPHDPRLAVRIAPTTSRASITWSRTQRRSPKAGFEPHLELLYHMSSFTSGPALHVKMCLPRWKDDKPGELPEVPTVSGVWRTADCHERERTTSSASSSRPPGPAAHRARRRLGWSPASQL